jgi:predicted nucleic acid-binding protein
LILVDTSVWIEFLRRAPPRADLREVLELGEVVTHPFVIGELALGGLGRRRAQILSDLRLLPGLPAASDAEVLDLIDARALAGRGIGWVDAHLVASALLAAARLWTLDARLARVASAVGLAGGPA